MQDGFSESERTAHAYFEDLGFIVEIPQKKNRRGYDFLLNLDYEGEKYSVTVEVKQHKSEPLLEPQLTHILNNDGLLVVVRNGKVLQVLTKEDIQSQRDITETLRRYTIKWK